LDTLCELKHEIQRIFDFEDYDLRPMQKPNLFFIGVPGHPYSFLYSMECIAQGVLGYANTSVRDEGPCSAFACS